MHPIAILWPLPSAMNSTSPSGVTLQKNWRAQAGKEARRQSDAAPLPTRCADMVRVRVRVRFKIRIGVEVRGVTVSPVCASVCVPSVMVSPVVNQCRNRGHDRVHDRVHEGYTRG